MRRRWEVSVRAGVVNCARCGQLIEAGALWDLGHVDGDRTRWSGPEHRACNRATLGRYGHVPGVARRLAYLEAKVPYGIVRCGRCGWRIRKGSGWRVVVKGRSTSCVSTSRVRLARQAVWMGRGCGRRTGAQGPTTSGAQQTLRREGRRPTCFRFILSQGGCGDQDGRRASDCGKALRARPNAPSVGSTTSVHTNRLIESPMSSLLTIHSTPLMAYVCPSTMSSPLMWGSPSALFLRSWDESPSGWRKTSWKRVIAPLSLALARWPGAVRAEEELSLAPSIRLSGVTVVVSGSSGKVGRLSPS